MKITDLAKAWWFVFSKMQKASRKKSKNGKPKDTSQTNSNLYFSKELHAIWVSWKCSLC